MRTLLATLLCLVLVTSGLGFWGWHQYEAPGPLTDARAVIVPHGGIDSTIAHLRDGGVLSPGRQSETVFRAAVALTRRQGQLHAAELTFPAHASIADVLLVLRHGHPVQHQITIPEGLTARRIAALIAAAPVLRGDVPPITEGSVLPQTYDYQWGMTRAQLVARMQSAMATTLTEVWRHRAPGHALASAADLVTLASIVERETALAEERPLVARVFLNRLASGMKLQSDPTTVYDLSAGEGVLDRPLTHADLAEGGPYNTYVIAALPPGPICAPGVAALEAVAHPASGGALYFVAMGDGGHAFADTLDAHNRNVARLRARQATSESVTP
ncbi:endolytic transglycosylase MltG [Ameyamaea chiangmaiensis]|uniref:Endolytic murein transglycosylase n=1 Tax=Ameyamaea chiangmaiensis TaxID=442969 RepID=A0A850P9E6_9PROT|nr:endolytic transglycosylase MltG [Ameyamaea chiangmaiensis]MBS4074798.1 endolytic transglycosylase MltG [Ameyamaea chiangmaiensis]NVN40644.1 endolytic transglycosylase MltG [Ameyamaea chiangmaiensis]